ncbi:hypothetical protein Nepgr_015451 [Nepenthes gracilis]|uniref:Uncharacterized protein n=1 Tax=Nepenthes gracilis TaxID=150966 RepID=A0AAD3SL27_NEPGR|nr:hypothetical protein Nepgr_015451 [Nepenthes gracilis]
MARILSLTLTLTRLSTSVSPLPIHLSPRILAYRNRSTLPSKVKLIEIDLESSYSDGVSDVEVVGIRKLQDVIHSIVIRRSAPDWLPFIPGSSYWVPPKPSTDNFVKFVGKLTNPLTEEEILSLTTARGWPSSSYFLEDVVSENSAPVVVHGQTNSGEASKKDED